MTLKEKAKDLYDKYFMKMESGIDNDGVWICMALNHGMAKSCALIAVDEILNALDSDRIIYGSVYRFEEHEFWEEVKQEIKSL